MNHQISIEAIFLNTVLWKLLHQILCDALKRGFLLVLIIGYQYNLHRIESVYIMKRVKPLKQRTF